MCVSYCCISEMCPDFWYPSPILPSSPPPSMLLTKNCWCSRVLQVSHPPTPSSYLDSPITPWIQHANVMFLFHPSPPPIINKWWRTCLSGSYSAVPTTRSVMSLKVAVIAGLLTRRYIVHMIGASTCVYVKSARCQVLGTGLKDHTHWRLSGQAALVAQVTPSAP